MVEQGLGGLGDAQRAGVDQANQLGDTIVTLVLGESLTQQPLRLLE